MKGTGRLFAPLTSFEIERQNEREREREREWRGERKRGSAE